VKLKELSERKGMLSPVRLLTAMAPAALQGSAAHYSQNRAVRAGRQRVLKFLVNSCYAWREDGSSQESITEE